MTEAESSVPTPPDPARAPAPVQAPVDTQKLRAFLSEIMIVVIGVLIALGLEQAVEAWHWQDQVANAQRALGNELSETVGQAHERIRVSACVDRRLDQIAAIVDAAADSGRLPPVGDIAMPPTRTWSNGVWTSTLAGQTGEHLSNEHRSGLSVVYGFVAMLSATNARELEDWTRLYALVGPGRAMTAQEAGDLRRAISEARTANQLMGLAGVRVEQLNRALDTELDRKLVASFDQPTDSYAICRPIGRVPAHYGAAPIANAIDRARAAPIGAGSAGRAVTGTSAR